MFVSPTSITSKEFAHPLIPKDLDPDYRGVRHHVPMVRR